jgi:hypothetical protein
MAVVRKDRCGEPEGKAQLLGDILWAILRTYFRLTVIADQVFGAYGLTAGKRAILRDLRVDWPRTISPLARSRPVARQYVQRLVAEMRRAGLAALKTNPADRRTKLAAREAAVVARLAEGFGGEELHTARAVVVALRDSLADNR